MGNSPLYPLLHIASKASLRFSVFRYACISKFFLIKIYKLTSFI